MASARDAAADAHASPEVLARGMTFNSLRTTVRSLRLPDGGKKAALLARVKSALNVPKTRAAAATAVRAAHAARTAGTKARLLRATGPVGAVAPSRAGAVGDADPVPLGRGARATSVRRCGAGEQRRWRVRLQAQP